MALQSSALYPIPSNIDWGLSLVPGSALQTVDFNSPLYRAYYNAEIINYTLRDASLAYRDLMVASNALDLSYRASTVFGNQLNRMVVPSVSLNMLARLAVDAANTSTPYHVLHVKNSDTPSKGVLTDQSLYTRDLAVMESLARTATVLDPTFRPEFIVGQVASIAVTSKGSGYTYANVVFSEGNYTTPATATASIFNGVVNAITVTSPGSGYTSTPDVTLVGDGTGATAVAYLTPAPDFTIDNVWSLGEGSSKQANVGFGQLNQSLLKSPDQYLAYRDNIMAAYAAYLESSLRNVFRNAQRLNISISSLIATIQVLHDQNNNPFVFYSNGVTYALVSGTNTGGQSREAETYHLTYEDANVRKFKASPWLSYDRLEIIYDLNADTVTWKDESLTDYNIPQPINYSLDAISFAGPIADGYLTTINVNPVIPAALDSAWYLQKAHCINFNSTVESTLFDNYNQYVVSSNTSTPSFALPFTGVSFDVGTVYNFYLNVIPNCEGEVTYQFQMVVGADTPFNIDLTALEGRQDVMQFAYRPTIYQTAPTLYVNQVAGSPAALAGYTVTIDEIRVRTSAPKEITSQAQPFKALRTSLLQAAGQSAKDAYRNSLAQAGFLPEYRMPVFQAFNQITTPWQLYANSFTTQSFTSTAGIANITVTGSTYYQTTDNITLIINGIFNVGDTLIFWDNGSSYMPPPVTTGVISTVFDNGNGTYTCGLQAPLGANFGTAGQCMLYISSGTVILYPMANTPVYATVKGVKDLVGSLQLTLSAPVDPTNNLCGYIVPKGYKAPVYTSSNLPRGLVLDPYLGQISGLPSQATPGIYPTTFSVSGPVTSTITIPIQIAESPVAPSVWTTTSTESWMNTIASTETRIRQAFRVGSVSDVGRPCLMPEGLAFVQGTVVNYYNATQSVPVIRAFQPWMLNAGIYVAEDDFWQPRINEISNY